MAQNVKIFPLRGLYKTRFPQYQPMHDFNIRLFATKGDIPLGSNNLPETRSIQL